jgi:formate-dependent nitrite reductase membrane component NrfD
MNEIDVIRFNHQIDPSLTIWGWEIPVYLFLGGLAAGVMILAGLLRLRLGGATLSRASRWLIWVAPVALSIGMLALFLDLANRQHVWRFYTVLRPTSPMSWGAWILIAIYPATVLFGLTALSDDEAAQLRTWRFTRPFARLLAWARNLGQTNERVLTLVVIGLGISLGTYTGLLLGTLAARPAWNSVILGPLFLISGLSTGAALMMLFPVAGAEHHALRRWDLAAIGGELLLLALFLLSLAASAGAEGSAAVALFFGGRYTAAFWTLVVLAGLLSPLILETVEARRGLSPTRVAPALILVGGLSLRWILVLAGQA